LNSPFEVKDLLKARGYRWHADAKVWVRDLADAERVAELEWLKWTSPVSVVCSFSDFWTKG
jgi:hypothetical protein